MSTIITGAENATDDVTKELAQDLGEAKAVAEEAKEQTADQWDELTKHREKLDLHDRTLDSLNREVMELPGRVGASSTALLEAFESRLATVESSLSALASTATTKAEETVEPPKPRANPVKEKPGGLRGFLHRLL